MALQQAQQHLISEEDYLAGELIGEIKHEYIDGKVFAMAGVSANHKRIVSNLLSAIHRHLLNTPCEVFAADMKVKLQNNFFYPDLVVDCENQRGDTQFLESPLIIIEVLSSSTRKVDQTLKRLAYLNLPKLEEYVLIAQDFVDVAITGNRNIPISAIRCIWLQSIAPCLSKPFTLAW